MCGICGIYHYKTGQPVDEALLRQMTRLMEHRGPDDEGLYLDGAVGLGFRRLSIIDLSGGAQPMSNEDDSLWIVFNGEIYNFLDLRPALEAQGHHFKTRADTEVILHTYEQYGRQEGLNQLNGMFGLGLWDAARRQIVLARDTFGVKPLYYYDDGQRLIFGSDIKPILAYPGVPRQVDLHALDEYLTFRFVPAPGTLFQNIHKLPPGYALVCDQNGSRLERYACWTPQIGPEQPQAAYIEGLQHYIEQGVRRQMISDVPIGVMLSGGVDSSTIATLMAQASSLPIKAFTVGFGGGFKKDELTPARQVAQRLGAEHYEVTISADEYFDFLPRFLWYSEEPTATSSALAFHYVCKLAREQVKVVLLGQGADEPFCGYQRHLAERYGGWYRAVPGWLRRYSIDAAIGALRRNESLKRIPRTMGYGDPLERLTRVYTIFDLSLKRQLYRPELDLLSGELPGKAAVARWQTDVRHLDGLAQMLYVDAHFSLSDWLLLYGDKMAMATSLEARVPFLDLELMKYAESIPSRLKIQGTTRKYLLKRAVSRWIPPEVIERPKVGFETPMDAWLQSALEGKVRELLLSSTSGCREYFSATAITSMLEQHRSSQEDYSNHLLILILFEIWYQQFIATSPV